MALRKANNPKVKVVFEFENCTGCPKVDAQKMPGRTAMDYFCKAMDGKSIMGYIEWSSEYKPVPEWCPHRETE